MQTTGFGLAAMALAAESGLLQSLVAGLETERAARMLALASFLCQSPRPNFAEFDEFVARNFAFLPLGGRFGRDDLARFMNYMAGSNREGFMNAWLPNCLDDDMLLLCDVRSYFCNCGQYVTSALPNNYGAGAPPKRNLAIFVGGSNGMPMYMWPLWGSLDDPGMLHEAIYRARGAGLQVNAKNAVILTDASFTDGRLRLMPLKGMQFICGLPIGRIPEVDAECLKFSKSLKDEDEKSAWAGGGTCYLSTMVRMKLDGVDGFLLVYKDLMQNDGCSMALVNRVGSAERLLKDTKRAPKAGFDEWAASFEPFFHVRKALNARGFEFESDREAYENAIHMGGACALFTTIKDMDEPALLWYYHFKCKLEQSFYMVRNGLSQVDLHIPQGMPGPFDNDLMLLFAALCLRKSFNRHLQSRKKVNPGPFSEVAQELSRLSYTWDGGQWRPKEKPGARQQEILEQFGINDRLLAILNRFLGLAGL